MHDSPDNPHESALRAAREALEAAAQKKSEKFIEAMLWGATMNPKILASATEEYMEVCSEYAAIEMMYLAIRSHYLNAFRL